MFRAFARGIYDPAGVYARNAGGMPRDTFLRDIERQLADKLRAKAVDAMKEDPQRYKVGMGQAGEQGWEEHIEEMASTTTWGGQTVAQALVDITGIPVVTYARNPVTQEEYETGMMTAKNIGAGREGPMPMAYDGIGHYRGVDPRTLGAAPEDHTASQAREWRMKSLGGGLWTGPEGAKGFQEGQGHIIRVKETPGEDCSYMAATTWIVREYTQWLEDKGREGEDCGAAEARTAWRAWGSWVRTQGWEERWKIGGGSWDHKSKVPRHLTIQGMQGVVATITHLIADPGKGVLMKRIRQSGRSIQEIYSERTTHLIVGQRAPGAVEESKAMRKAREKQQRGGNITITTEEEMWQQWGPQLGTPDEGSQKSPGKDVGGGERREVRKRTLWTLIEQSQAGRVCKNDLKDGSWKAQDDCWRG